ncbi:hypothetical protein [Gracilibacillus salinarum]|uniref:Uncharacterized protein n=1 Tax=Gracilibacillus salinarum TaxID=2932255 RepID=A0ABY4GLG9_9BACI|nr:hypothetical protein [Gracilibacillus salinarum]UOQ85084.1 hypothetical protein MUN87_20965 [Gracilibacillus salinarum]
MNRKRYRVIPAMLVFLGFVITYYVPSAYPYVFIVIAIFVLIFGWKEVKMKLQQATTEDEIRPIVVPVILTAMVFIIGILSLVL